MDDKEINDYCNNDVETTSNYEVFMKVTKYLENFVINELADRDVRIDILNLKIKILYLIIALLVILKIIGG